MPDPMPEWGQYRYFVVEELKRINTAIESVNSKIEQFRQEDLGQLKTDVALLKFQAAMWGGVAAAVVTAVITLVVKFIR